MKRKEELNAMKGRKITQEEAIRFFDSLEIAPKELLYGKWKGSELSTGHPMEGLLTASKWHGKQFIDDENVHPLVFDRSNGAQFLVNPGMLPMNLPVNKFPKKLIGTAIKLFRPLIKTKKSRARLRMVEYRGKVSASMVYDQVGIIDVFRKVDDNTIFGAMDIKAYPDKRIYFFILERE